MEGIGTPDMRTASNTYQREMTLDPDSVSAEEEVLDIVEETVEMSDKNGFCQPGARRSNRGGYRHGRRQLTAPPSDPVGGVGVRSDPSPPNFVPAKTDLRKLGPGRAPYAPVIPLRAYQRDGGPKHQVDLTEADRDQLAGAWFTAGGSWARVAAQMGWPYSRLTAWAATDPSLKARIAEADAILKDLRHARYVDRVDDPEQRHPAWLIFYLKHHDARYAESVQQRAVTVVVRAEGWRQAAAGVGRVIEAVASQAALGDGR